MQVPDDQIRTPEVLTPGLPGLLARVYGGYRRLRGSTLGNLLATAS